jgi:hypothetical protein
MGDKGRVGGGMIVLAMLVVFAIGFAAGVIAFAFWTGGFE